VNLEKLEKNVDAALSQKGGPLSVSDAARSLCAESKEFAEAGENRTAAEIEKYLESHPGVFFDRGKGVFISRAEVLEGAELAVTPGDFELERGILIPGHRFAPFCREEVFPSEVKLLTGEGKKSFRVKEVKCPMVEAARHSSLLGSDDMFDYFIADHEDNGELVSAGKFDLDITLSVFDLSAVFKANSFAPGDALIFSVQNWEKGVFKFERAAPASARPENARREWIKKLEDALTPVIEEHGVHIEIPDQISRAFFIAGKELLREPAAGADDINELAQNVRIGVFSDRTSLILSENLPPGDGGGSAPENFMVSKGRTGSLEDLLKDCGCPVNMVEIESFMRDELYAGAENMDSFFARCFGQEKLKFADDAQEAFFLNFTEDMWETIAETYNRAEDAPAAPVRAMILESVSERADWLRWLQNAGADPDKLAESPVFKNIAGTAARLTQTLSILNSSAGSIDAEDLERLADTVEDLAARQAEMISEINISLLGPED
jgi:hypothetical protein